MACRWQPGMKIAALLDALNSALAEPYALAWVSDSPRFLLVFTVIYAVAVIVAVTDQKNTRPGAEHGSAAWGDVFRLNKFYMDKRGPNLLLTQHFHIGIDGYKHKHNTNILIAVSYTHLHRSGVRTGRFSQGLHLQPPSLRCAELLCRLHGRASVWAGHRRFQL